METLRPVGGSSAIGPVLVPSSVKAARSLLKSIPNVKVAVDDFSGRHIRNLNKLPCLGSTER